jgi:hypothetical protein
MKRDTLDVRMDEIRELATKYSKEDLGRMVQMRMLDPQEALMAGMMIDRIAKSAMQPPRSTVIQDVLGQQPTTAQGQLPPGIMGAPGAPPPSAGVAALPSGIREMAGGGIVAFDEGGEVPGYAERGYVDSRNDPAMRVSPRTQAIRDEDRYRILAAELLDAQRRLERGDPRAEGDIKALQRDMRRMKPAPSADAGIGALLPSAEAAPVAPTQAAPAAPAAAAPEYMYQDPFGAPSVTEGDVSLKQKVELGKPYDPSVRGALFGYDVTAPKPAATTPAKPAAPPSKFEVKPVEERPAPAPAPALSARTEPEITPPKRIEAQQIPLPKDRTLKDEAAEIQAAYKELGVDTDMYKNQMKELEGKKAGLAKRREQALGTALMAFGFGLAGAREGQEYQQLSSEGQKALGLYMNSMDKIVENEDRIDMLNRQLQMAENNFKRTGADSALTQMRARRERIDQIEAKNAELKQNAEIAQAQVGASVYGVQVGADVRKDIARQNVMARVAAALGSNKGGFTDKQLDELYDKVEMQNRGRLEDLYKDKYYGPALEQKIAEELVNLTTQRAKQASTIRQKGGIAAPSDGSGQWSVQQIEAGVD